MTKKRSPAMITVSLAIAALLFLLPSLACLPPVLHSLTSLLNRQLSGTLEVQSCSLGWWQGLRCENLRYQDPVQGVRVTAPRLTGDKGLFVLLAAPSYLGEITIEQPTLTVLPQPAGAVKTKQEDTASAGPAGQQPVAVVPEDAVRTPWWERLTFRLKVNKGLVVLDQGQNPGQELARDLDLKGSLAGGTVNYALAFRSGLEQQGQLRAEGFINLPTARQSLLDALISQTEVEIKGLEITAFLDLAASRGNFPRGKGVLDATCHLVTAGIEDLEIRGETGFRGVRLAGGFLGRDQPAVDHLLFKFKGSHNGREGWRLDTLNLESDPVRISANGSYDHATVSLAAKGVVNLPSVAVQLPHLLALHEKTTFSEGIADFSLNVSGTPQDLAMKADCRTGRLAVVHNGQFFSWDTPLALVAEADRHQGKTTFRTLQAHTPFLDAQGSGGAEDFTLRATADLDRMFQELDKIFALDFHGKGQVEITGSSRVREDGGYQLDSRIGINDFALSRGRAPLFRPHNFFLSGEAWGAPSFFRDGTLNSFQFETSFWPGKVSLFVKDIERKTGPVQASCAVKGVVDLERMSTFLHGLAGVAPSFKLKGELSLDGSGGWQEKRLSLAALEGKIDQLVVTGAGYSHKEPRVTVSLANRAAAGTNPVAVRELLVAENWRDFTEKELPVLLVDFQRQQLDLRHLTVKTAGATARGSLFLGNWHQPRRDFTTEVTGESEAALLVTLLKAAGWFSEEVTIKGRARTTLKAGASEQREVLTELAVQIKPFELRRAKEKLFTDPHLRLKATLQGDIAGDGEVTIPAFVLQTTPLQVEGTGVVQRSAPASLELQGALTPDLSYFSKLLTAAISRKVVLAGKREGLFLLSCPLKLPVDWNQLTLAARLPVDSLQYQGIDLKQLDIPVDINRGGLRAVLAGELNGGGVSLQPQWDFGVRRPALTLPSSSRVLQDVALRQPLVDGVLVKLHPLFGVLARPEGSVDLRLDDFSWPIAAKGEQPVFTATMGLSKIQLKPTKVLREILALGGFEQEVLLFKEPEVICRGRDSRITCTPVHLLVGETEIAISGSVSMDGSLDYLVQMTVTESLAGKMQLPMQQGVLVKAAIAGTLDAPFFDQKAFLAMVTDQLGQAVKGPEKQPAEPAQDKPPGAGP